MGEVDTELLLKVSLLRWVVVVGLRFESRAAVGSAQGRGYQRFPTVKDWL
jgi:hypothetical protein